MAVEYEHTWKVVDMESLAEHPMRLVTPFPLPLTDAQIETIMQILVGALPSTAYGFRVAASVRETTTAVDTVGRQLPPIQVPGTP